MHRIFNLITVLAITGFTTSEASAQALYNNGATLFVNSGATLRVNGNLTNATGGSISNRGAVTLTGNLVNDNSIGGTSTGAWAFAGTGVQTVSGSGPQFVPRNLTVNNAAGITLNQVTVIENTVTFTAGLINVPGASAPLFFGSGATVSGTPSDASHVNGYVRRLGTGAFTFPVGDATRYQPVAVNLTANAAGLTALYVAGNAGTGPFTGGGMESTPLVTYNNKEYWDLTPVSTATGTVTLTWDGVNETSYTVANRRVAHKVGGSWLNEGGTGSGTNAAGTITSNSISSWSPFTNGSLSFPLPLHWLAINGLLNNQKQAVLQWTVQEADVAQYEVEKSTDARSFTSVTTISSKGSGTNNYSLTDANSMRGTAYYRIKQVAIDGRFSYSAILKLRATDVGSGVSLYPNPAKDAVLITVPSSLLHTQAAVLSADGKRLQTILVEKPVFSANVSGLTPGIYLISFADGTVLKLVKE